jgi:hypothetical protein
MSLYAQLMVRFVDSSLLLLSPALFSDPILTADDCLGSFCNNKFRPPVCSPKTMFHVSHLSHSLPTFLTALGETDRKILSHCPFWNLLTQPSMLPPSRWLGNLSISALLCLYRRLPSELSCWIERSLSDSKGRGGGRRLRHKSKQNFGRPRKEYTDSILNKLFSFH